MQSAASAGIKPVMITGDHVVTASAIAKELRHHLEDGDRAITGAELDAMTDRGAWIIRLNKHFRLRPRIA